MAFSVDHTGAGSCCSGVVSLLMANLPRGSLMAGLVPAVTAAAAIESKPAEAQQPAPTPTTVWVAKNVVTMEAPAPANAVAVANGQIIAVGLLEELTAALPPGSFTIDRRFEKSVMLPGLIEQHLHPLLGALSISTVTLRLGSNLITRTLKSQEGRRRSRPLDAPSTVTSRAVH